MVFFLLINSLKIPVYLNRTIEIVQHLQLDKNSKIGRVYFVGLVTLEQMKARQEDVVQARERQIANTGECHLEVGAGHHHKGKKNKRAQVPVSESLVLSMDIYGSIV